MKFPGIKILDRYIIRKFLGTYLFAIALIIIVVVIFDAAEKMDDFSPIDENSACFVDTTYTKAYLRHLTIAGEMLAAQIASMHNLAFYLWLVGEARKRILDGTFCTWKSDMVEKLSRRL